jgi:hypothetical protein
MEDGRPYRGDYVWPSKRAVVIEMADLKALFIKINCSFISNPDVDVKYYPLQLCVFKCV